MKLYADKLLYLQEKLTDDEYNLITRKDVSIDDLKSMMADHTKMEYLAATPTDDEDYKHLPFGVGKSGDYEENIILRKGPSPIERINDPKYSPLVGRWIWDVFLDSRRWSSKFDGMLRGERLHKNEVVMSDELYKKYGKPFLEELGSLTLRGIIYPFFNQILATDRHYLLKHNPSAFLELDTPKKCKDLSDDDFLITVVYRGQSKRYPTVLTPTLFRNSVFRLTQSSSNGFSKLRTYFRNATREYLYEKTGSIFSFAEAEAFLHHFGLMRTASVVDVTRDVNIAKWFALSRFKNTEESLPLRQIYKIKQFDDYYSEHSWSYVYKIIICVPGKPKIWGLYDELSTIAKRPKNQAGLCIHELYRDDLDPNGAVVSVSEHKYHPKFCPNGWDDINGPNLEFETDDGDISCEATDLSNCHSVINDFLFPEETGQICDLITHLIKKRKDHFFSKYPDIEKLFNNGKI